MLNGYSSGFSVSPGVRERINLAVDELGYAANPISRTLCAKETKLVQVVNQPAPTMHPSGDAVIALGTCIYFLQQNGFSVSARFVRCGPERQPNLPDFRVDGAVLVGVAHANEVNALEGSGTPYVVINGECGANGACVKIDEREGMRLAVDHLVSLGHTRIAYLCSHQEFGGKVDLKHYSVSERRAAYRDLLVEKGLKPVPGWTTNYDGAGEFLRRTATRHRVTATIAYSHMTAIDLYQQLRATSTVVPEDLSVVCFNDHPPTAYVTPALTAVHQPYNHMGYEGSQLLLRMMGGEAADAKGTTVTLKPSLTVRDSTSSARDA